MPLRDHFRPPLDNTHSWDELHGGWPMVIVQHLVKTLPEPYYAAPSVYLGARFEVDIGTYRELDPRIEREPEGEGAGGVAVAVYAPPKPTITVSPRMPNQDIYEVRIYDSRRNRRLVAAIELVSPANKDRLEHRESFASKVAVLVKSNVCVTIVDVVSTMRHNLYADLMRIIESADPALGDTPPPMYAVTLRTRYEGFNKLLDTWYHPLDLGQPLPTLPVWLREKFAVSLDLETTYEETCRTLRIR